eukprot:896079-Pyramimonas_sp.AAC.1
MLPASLIKATRQGKVAGRAGVDALGLKRSLRAQTARGNPPPRLRGIGLFSERGLGRGWVAGPPPTPGR